MRNDERHELMTRSRRLTLKKGRETYNKAINIVKTLKGRQFRKIINILTCKTTAPKFMFIDDIPSHIYHRYYKSYGDIHTIPLPSDVAISISNDEYGAYASPNIIILNPDVSVKVMVETIVHEIEHYVTDIKRTKPEAEPEPKGSYHEFHDHYCDEINSYFKELLLYNTEITLNRIPEILAFIDNTWESQFNEFRQYLLDHHEETDFLLHGYFKRHPPPDPIDNHSCTIS